MDDFELSLPEVPDVPATIGPDVDELNRLLQVRANDAGRIIVLEAQLKFTRDVADAAIQHINKELESTKKTAATARSDARKEHAEAEALAKALASLLEYVPLDPQDPYPDHLCHGQQKTRAEAEEVLKLYHERHD